MTAPDLSALTDLVMELIATQLDLQGSAFAPEQNFIELGIDSVEAVFLCGALEERLSSPVDPVLVFESASIHDFVAAVQQALAKARTGTAQVDQGAVP